MTDAIDQAMNATWSPITTNFGQINVDVWACALEKGQGKIPFDPGIHSPDRKFTAIVMSINAIRADGTGYELKREMIAESREWVQITLPSLKALKADLRGLNGKYVQVQLVPNGRKWTTDGGEEKEGTTFKFTKVFASEAECEAAKTAFRGNTGDDAPVSPVSAAPASSAAPDPERSTAAKFLPAYWVQSGKDPIKFAEKIKDTPILSKHFDINSPEIAELILAG